MEGWRQSSTNVITNFLFQTKAVSFWAVFCLYIVLKISLDITRNVSECLVLLFNIVLKYTIDNVLLVVGGGFTRKIKPTKQPPNLTGRYYTLIRNFFAFTANSNFAPVRRY